MEFIFDHFAPHQLSAIRAVTDVFKGQPNAGGFFDNSQSDIGSVEFGERGIGNRLVLSPESLLKNISEIQKSNGLAESVNLVPRVDISEDLSAKGVDLNISVEMETGTGKTYSYIRTIYELYKTYGFCKFVIVVPSVAIREGTLKNLEITAKEMKALYGIPANYTVWDSANRNALRNFSASNSLQILIINIDSFASDSNIINTVTEQGVKPIEFLQATNPIVIVDEPQNMETPIRRRAIDNLNPLCTLRYSATHKNPYNLISRLTPVDAYNAGLVKQIQVDGITAEQNYNAAFVALKEIQRGKVSLKAKVTIFVNGEAGSVNQKDVALSLGDDLFVKSNRREIYRDGFILESIEADKGLIEFSGGLILRVGDSQGGFTDELQQFQIERTVRWHFERAKKLHPLGIKVLSLFFIDKVANYRSPEGKAKFEEYFEEAFTKYSKKSEYKGLIPYRADEVHRGYFSQDKKGVLKDTKGVTKDDEDTYSLIMKNKEELLHLENPVQFIFSHSALREGWDNPNVFQICTLNESVSEVKKRQEVGRGLRLPVNSSGLRIVDKDINLLTVIANESYEAFTRALQTEIEEDTGIPFTGKIADANRAKVQVRYTKAALTRENYPLLFDLWDRVSFHTRYAVSYEEATLVNKAIQFLKDKNHYPTVTRLTLQSNTAKIQMSGEGLLAQSTSNALRETQGKANAIPDVFGFIQSRIKLSRSSIAGLFKECGRIDELMINPQRFLEYVVAVFERAKNEILYEGGVKYEKGPAWDASYTQKLFTDELGEVLQDQVLEVRPDFADKTAFNYYRTDSAIEDNFARDCEVNEAVKFFFKIPKGFKIPTPIGNYTPDWAVVLEHDSKLYFVSETKGTLDPGKLRDEERFKIRMGGQFFSALQTDIGYKLAVKASDLIKSA